MGQVAALRPGELARAEPGLLVEAWLRELDAAGRMPRTLAGHRWHLTDALTALAAGRGAALDQLVLASVSHADLVDYLAAYRHAPDRRHTRDVASASRERSDYTMARRIATIRSFFAWAALHAHIPLDPSAGLRAPKIREHLPRALEVPDASLIFEAAALSRFPERDTAIVAVALGGGHVSRSSPACA